MTNPITITNQAALEQGQRVARERELPDELPHELARLVDVVHGDLDAAIKEFLAIAERDDWHGRWYTYLCENLCPRLIELHKAAPPVTCDKCERLRAIREVLPLALKAIDEAYEATGHCRVAKTSAERQAIETAILSLPREVSPDEQPRLYLDCDGVLADFDSAFEAAFGHAPRDYEDKHGAEVFWRDIKATCPTFYRDLPLMPDARELFEAVKHLRPIILTGCPRGEWAELQKLAWAAENFPGTPMVVCRARDKCLYLQPGDILIDDRTQYRDRWEKAGGVFIHHTSAKESLAALSRQLPAAKAGQDIKEAAADEIRRLREAIDLLDATAMNEALQNAGVPCGVEGVAALTAEFAALAERESKMRSEVKQLVAAVQAANLLFARGSSFGRHGGRPAMSLHECWPEEFHAVLAQVRQAAESPHSSDCDAALSPAPSPPQEDATSKPIACYLTEEDPPEDHDLTHYGAVCGRCYGALADLERAARDDLRRVTESLSEATATIHGLVSERNRCSESLARYERWEQNRAESEKSLNAQATCGHPVQLKMGWEDGKVHCWECEWIAKDAELATLRERLAEVERRANVLDEAFTNQSAEVDAAAEHFTKAGQLVGVSDWRTKQIAKHLWEAQRHFKRAVDSLATPSTERPAT